LDGLPLFNPSEPLSDEAAGASNSTHECLVDDNGCRYRAHVLRPERASLEEADPRCLEKGRCYALNVCLDDGGPVFARDPFFPSFGRYPGEGASSP
jgi:hypothetical protein